MEKRYIVILAMIIVLSISAADALPSIELEVGSGNEGTPQEYVDTIEIMVLLTVLTLAPAILVLMTSFTRIVIVLGFVRNALATQQTPPNQVIIGLALFLTVFVMMPTWNVINETALQPYLDGQIEQSEAFELAQKPLKSFMLKQTREKDLTLFYEVSGEDEAKPEDLSLFVVTPAFVISELKSAFQMGFMVFVPFLVIDMVVASTLMSMGMMMLPPVMISLPFKILLFVLVDGWHLIVNSLLQSFN